MVSQASPDEWQPQFHIGYHDSTRNDPILEEHVDQALDCNYNMLTTYITNNHFHTRVNALASENLAGEDVPTVSPLTELDTHLEPIWISDLNYPRMIAVTSPWIDICSPDPLIAGISKQILFMEVRFAAFCGFIHIMIQGPKLAHHDPLRGKDVETNNLMQYARAVQECIDIGMRLQISVVLPFSDDAVARNKELKTLGTRDNYIDPDLDSVSPSVDYLGTWETWNTVRVSCKYHARLSVALQMPQFLPTAHVQSRWFSEPVKALYFDESSFATNARGFPSLQSSMQSFLRDIMRLKAAPWIVLADVGGPPIPNRHGETQFADGNLHPDALQAAGSKTDTSREPSSTRPEDQLAHLNYLRHIEGKQEPFSELEGLAAAYQDYLQIPLQPLTDNLESMTYEVFEKDPVKYDLYEQAIEKALRDWADQRKPTSGPDGKIVVVVAGAGRGPLVRRALKASKAAKVPIDMWAVEKNPNAFVLLQRHNRETWKRQVSLEQSDMRSWKGPWRHDYAPTPAEASNKTSDPAMATPSKVFYPVDILISELLGSFGDNELSPECLDGILHLLAKPNGISIPRSYTAWLTPISAPKLHADTLQRISYDPAAAETPAVVLFHRIDYLSRETVYRDRPKQDSLGSDHGLKHTSSVHSSSTSRDPNILCAWEFEHAPDSESTKEQRPAGASNQHNWRSAKLEFRIRNRGVCHGLAGYFESVLYPGIELSTNPNTIDAKSKDMTSWFPIFFPLKNPLYVPSTSTLDVSIWRQTDGRKVWYEWMIESWGWNLMRTGKGKEGDKVDRKMTRLGMTELHSSIRNACLM